MIKFLLRKIFGTSSERFLKKIRPKIEEINSLEKKYGSFGDSELAGMTAVFKQRLEKGEELDELLADAFAVVREVARRTLKMRHFDVQLMGGIVLHYGNIAEMKTGEGKTLVATLPAYLNALTGRGVHIVTVNDYLARRDAEWMGAIYRFLGMSVGCIQHGLNDAERKAAYNCDITYGTNNEFGFDYLRDNMKFRVEQLCQREFHYAIVDEVDSILIDEARTPLIISGPTEESPAVYYRVNDFVKRIKNNRDYFDLDEKSRTVVLTEKGIAEAEKFFHIENLFDLKNMDLLHQIYQSLKAHLIFRNEVDYIVKDGQVLIVDEFTGRIMPGRRYSDGLHQALEAKENVKIEQEYQTLASITFQNYFRMYRKLAGMTGTAATEAEEFRHIYGLDVIEIPTNKPLNRIEFPDVIYATKEEKWRAVVAQIRELYNLGRPVLVGTISIENSELLSSILNRERIRHVVLNAKHHEREAEIVAQAGRLHAVTIATNMAGRGTDILLGGNPDFLSKEELKKKGFTLENAPRDLLEKVRSEIEELVRKEREKVIQLGGLFILGTERHEARRIDNQLRGRSGRQGDPGASRFYISLEDELMRILGSDRIRSLMIAAGMKNGVPIESKLVSRAIENAQKQIESQNFSIRKHLLQYDDVMNVQRRKIYTMRREVLFGKDLRTDIEAMIEAILADICRAHIDPQKDYEDWNLDSLRKELLAQFNFNFDEHFPGGVAEFSPAELEEKICQQLLRIYQQKEELMGSATMRELEREVMLQVIDLQWKDHLLNIDHLREGIGLRGYAQKDPLIEYKKESFLLFEALINRIEEEVVRLLFFFRPISEEEMQSWKKERSEKKSVMPAARIASSKKHKKGRGK